MCVAAALAELKGGKHTQKVCGCEGGERGIPFCVETIPLLLLLCVSVTKRYLTNREGCSLASPFTFLLSCVLVRLESDNTRATLNTNKTKGV